MRRSDYRWGVLIALLVVLGGLGGLVLSRHHHPYAATASLVYQPGTIEEALLGQSAPQTPSSEQLATEVALVQARPVINAAVARLRHGRGSAGTVGQVSAAAAGSSNIIYVTATSPTPSSAVALSNAVVNVFAEQQRRVAQAQIAAAQRGLAARLATLDRQPSGPTVLSEKQAVNNQQATLSALGAVDLSGTSVVDHAVGATITGHSKKSLVALGLIAGLVVGLILFWIVVQVRGEPKTDLGTELDGFTERTYLSLTRASRRAAREQMLRGADAGRISHLAVVLGLEPRGAARVVLCAPADSSAGRFDLAWRLAQASAALGTRTLYVMVTGAQDPDLGEDGTPAPVASNLSTLSLPVTAPDLNDRLRAMVQPDGRPFGAVLVSAWSLADDATSLRLAARSDAVVLFSINGSPAEPAVESSLSALGHVGAPQPDFVSVSARPA